MLINEFFDDCNFTCYTIRIMKIKTQKNPDDLVTIKEWVELVEFIGENVTTKDDLQNLKTELVDKFENVFATKEDMRQMMEKSEEKTGKIRDDVLSAKDEILHEVKAMREEQIMHAGLHKIITDESETLKKRVTNVEYRIGIEPVAA